MEVHYCQAKVEKPRGSNIFEFKSHNFNSQNHNCEIKSHFISPRRLINMTLNIMNLHLRIMTKLFKKNYFMAEMGFHTKVLSWNLWIAFLVASKSDAHATCCNNSDEAASLGAQGVNFCFTHRSDWMLDCCVKVVLKQLAPVSMRGKLFLLSFIVVQEDPEPFFMFIRFLVLNFIQDAIKGFLKVLNLTCWNQISSNNHSSFMSTRLETSHPETCQRG